MNFLSKPKVFGYLVAIFATGMLAGAVWGYTSRKEKSLTPPKADEMAIHMAARLRDQLHLTESQYKQIEPILQETAAEVCSAQRECRVRVREMIVSSNRRITAFLTPSQISALEALQKRTDDDFRRHESRRGKRPPEPNN